VEVPTWIGAIAGAVLTVLAIYAVITNPIKKLREDFASSVDKLREDLGGRVDEVAKEGREL